jgi:hypothetical protein
MMLSRHCNRLRVLKRDTFYLQASEERGAREADAGQILAQAVLIDTFPKR